MRHRKDRFFLYQRQDGLHIDLGGLQDLFGVRPDKIIGQHLPDKRKSVE